ncbi:MAG: polysaccharide deacetylase [Hydrogenophilales bacterium 28-61-11]|nr:MAG: polysaccharide deacetylase [Hydrogenophilales bacterium 28-61-11]OYZ57832.1 MAG: polysaccharide deacetylase [Hydrogenophilales bacterium 16-61-112]OZA48566.1 MAG: polysaccharide deacetylase [Hydrogenophilales bacterium 17-61-76]
MYSVPFKRIAAGALVVALMIGGFVLTQRKPPTPSADSIAASSPSPRPDTSALRAGLVEVLASYRKIIVLLADEKTLSRGEREAANQAGQALFHDNLARLAKLDEALDRLATSPNPMRFDAIGTLLDYIESDPGLYDADRLAFRELLQSLQASVARDTTLPAIKMHKRISDDLDALAEIERNYEKEIRQIFGRFDQRAIKLKRERWDDYVAHLKKLYSREQILKDYGMVLPYPAPRETPAGDATRDEPGEIFGRGLPRKTVALTFDDGPHRLYSDEIAAILKQYGAPAVFFNVGRNLGSVGPDGTPKLGAGAKVSRKLMAEGYVLGNHSFTHAQLSRKSGDALKAEIFNTDALLKAVNPNRSSLFRFPYGAHNGEGLHMLEAAHLKSVMWNIDSLDWADPVPASIAERVLREVDREGRGIILFHDIHDRAVKALPAILDRLTAEGYRFAGWDGSAFTVARDNEEPVAKAAVQTGYGESWAVVVGIDDYAKWPRLQYAVRDAQAVGQDLVEKFGFKSDHVFTLRNGEATRSAILALFHDKLAHGGVGKNDRIFVFFAGHGATRHLSSGRDLGYIVPADSDPAQFATDAIPMTEIQNIAEGFDAKHVLFVMDACYSGLGLTRGGGSSTFLRDNAKRIGRQMLTAGGTDQLVADGGPNGHSVFTWTFLQALAGKGDLNGDGLITATELAAYVAPAVSAVSQQTPAFGSLPGSEGGDFVFELPSENEFLGTQTAQLSNEAIALNSKQDAARTPAPGKAIPAVIVKDLQGGEQKIVPPAAVPISRSQLAQRANDRGLQLYKEKQYAAAEAQFTEALKLRPDFALAANNLGFVYYKQEKYAEAARWFENAIKLDPSRAIAYLNLGDARARDGESVKAKKAYQIYLELAPNGSGAGHVKQELEKL